MKKAISACEQVLYQLTVSFKLQSRRSMSRFGYAGLTLNERPKVKSVHTRRFPAHDFLHDGFTSQTSRTNNKRVIELLSLAMLV